MDPDYALFVRIVAAGSLSAAARATGASPAKISKRLARLEDRLGVRLLHRTTRRMVLTEPGFRFHEELLVISAALRAAEARLDDTRVEATGPLRVSAPTSFGRLHIAPRLHAFLAAHPRVELRLDLSDDYVDLIATRTDVAVRIAGSVPADLQAHRLAGNRRILCASRSYIAAHGLPDDIGGLAGHRLLAAAGQLPWRLQKGGHAVTIEGKSHVATNSSELVRELALSGVGIALRSLWDVQGALASGALLPVLPGWEGSSDLAIHAVHPRGATTTPAIRAFIAFLQDIVGAEAWAG